MLDAIAAVLLYVLSVPVDALPVAGDLTLPGLGGLTSLLRTLDSVTGIGGPLTFLAGLLSAAPALVAVRTTTWAYRLLPGKMT